MCPLPEDLSQLIWRVRNRNRNRAAYRLHSNTRGRHDGTESPPDVAPHAGAVPCRPSRLTHYGQTNYSRAGGMEGWLPEGGRCFDVNRGASPPQPPTTPHGSDAWTDMRFPTYHP